MLRGSGVGETSGTLRTVGRGYTLVRCPARHTPSRLELTANLSYRSGWLGQRRGASSHPSHLAVVSPCFLASAAGRAHCSVATGGAPLRSRAARPAAAEQDWLQVLGVECTAVLPPLAAPLIFQSRPALPRADAGGAASPRDAATSKPLLTAADGTPPAAAAAAGGVPAEGAPAEPAADAAAASDDAAANANATAAEGEQPSAAADEAEGEGAPDDGEILPLEQWKERALLRIQTDHSISPTNLDVQAAAAVGAAGAERPAGGGDWAPPDTFIRPTTPLKDRFNYLSEFVGAKVLAKAPEMKGSGNVLTEDKDKYASRSQLTSGLGEVDL